MLADETRSVVVVSISLNLFKISLTALENFGAYLAQHPGVPEVLGALIYEQK